MSDCNELILGLVEVVIVFSISLTLEVNEDKLDITDKT